jgi:L-seryl-tRNA(Ser) seleniumtransferase
VLEALNATALAYLRRQGDAIPFWAMATTPVDTLWQRALALGAGTPVHCSSVPGGGSLPGLSIPSAGVLIDGDVTGRLRNRTPPIVARVHDGATVLDLRTVDAADDIEVAKALGAL